MLHLKYKTYVIISLVLLWIDNVQSQACSSSDISSIQFDFGYDNPNEIEASFRGVIAEFQMENTLSIDNTENSAMNQLYIDATLENGILRIITTNEFSNYEAEQSKNVITLIINLRCTTGSKPLIFRQKIKESNNHSPVFSQDVYEIVVLLPLPQSFDLSFYQEVSARDIDLKNNRVTFSSNDSTIIDVGTSNKIGADGKTFYATLIANKQILTIHNPIEFTIIGTDSGTPPRYGTAKIIITGDEQITYIPMPIFDKVLYQGTLDSSYKLIIEKLAIKNETFSNDIAFNLTGTDSALFSIQANLNEITITLSKNLMSEDLNGKMYLTTTIIAARPEVDTGSAVILIDIPEKPEPPKPIPVPNFKKSLYRGELNDDFELHNLDTISIDNETFSDGLTFSLYGDDNLWFSFIQTDYELKISLNRQITENDLEFKSYLTFNVLSKNSIGNSSETVVIIDVPEKLCPECPIPTTQEPSTCPPIVVCPECPTTTTPPPTTTTTTTTTQTPATCPTCPPTSPPMIIDYTPRFENRHYSFWIKSHTIGSIGKTLATVEADKSIAVQYSIENVNDVHLGVRLTINIQSGELSLVDIVNSGVYDFKVAATNTNDGSQGYASVTLTVETLLSCPDGNTTVGKSLMIKYLKEGAAHKNIMTTQIENCAYEIISMNPHDKEYFEINPITNTLDSIEFYREDSIFQSYAIPQIQITMKLNCDTSPTRLNINQNIEPANISSKSIHQNIHPFMNDGRWYVLANDIDYTPDITVLTVIIEDINNNKPIIEKPLDGSCIGYPAPKLVDKLLPEHLIQVHATDLDAFENAKIRYSLAEQNHFKIVPETGIIYPTQTSMVGTNFVELEIIATDRDGAEDGLKSVSFLNVVKLEINHLTVISVQVDGQAVDANDVVEMMRKEGNINLMVLQSAFVPNYVRTPSGTNRTIFGHWMRQEEMDSLKMIVYAFGDVNELLTTTDVQKKISKIVDDTYKFTSIPFELIENISQSNNLEENFILLIVIAILGALLLITGIGMICMWWFKIRPYEYESIIDSGSLASSSRQSLDKPLESERKMDGTIPPFRLSRFEIEKRRDSMNISGVTAQDSTDQRTSTDINNDGSQYDNNDTTGDRPRENRKSQNVTFNELVERIDIETMPVARDSYDNIRL